MRRDAGLRIGGPAVTAGATAACLVCDGPLRARDAALALALHRCRTCGSLSAWPLPTNAELTAYYNSDYAVADAGLTARRRRNWSGLIDLAERDAPGRRGLEIGSSNGAFLRYAASRGWEMAGVELDERARRNHERASPAIPAYPSVRAARDAGLGERDAVWALHTVEHLPDPTAALREVAALLAPGGVLVLTTPNGDSLECTALGRLWEWWTPPAHLTLLSPAGVRTLLIAAGLHVLGVESRRGDSAGLATNALLAPARLLRRHVDGPRRQRSSVSAWSQRAAAAVNALYDPLSSPLRALLYRRLLGPELVAVARRSDARGGRAH